MTDTENRLRRAEELVRHLEQIVTTPWYMRVPAFVSEKVKPEQNAVTPETERRWVEDGSGLGG